ncbi:carbamoyltransferase C-terminal domain-containing protein [Phnomibacter ginsenosidimutans]|uniref:Glycosyltransferase n=1 Tax=Phnomibacter ginsenosidimutans TaxID=2676868 RepID=A0A6I6H603_9BACT|nr:carbamoyltransferase C-terminal domain-containing protein [Phnomibacter ginsenosidimutans]QGW29741.1 glycosyltransferase [Phnomibacter ginsenosidimutans]
MHYLHIIPYYLPDVAFGGPVFSASGLCESLVKAGNKVSVYTVGYQSNEQYPQQQTINGVTVTYFKGDAGKPCQVSRQLWQALDQTCTRFDVVHLHTWWNVLIFRSIQILNRQQVPFVVSPRGMMSDYSFTHRKTFVKRNFQKWLGVKLLRKAGLHATSQAEAADMAIRSKRAERDIHIMPNLLNLKAVANYQPAAAGFSIGFLSRLHHKKGIEELLRAVAITPHITELVIGGRGDDTLYEQRLQQLIADLGIAEKVRFVGWVSDEEKPAFFRQFQVFVLPSFNENFANVVAEAWANGKPTIVSTGVGISHYVAEYGLGWICEANPQSISQALHRAWEQQPLWAQMGSAAIDLVNAQFTDDRILAQYIGMYEKILATGKNTAPAAGSADVYVLGINAHHADASAAVLKNGELIAAIEEERIRRIKHWAGFPTEAIRFCLSEAGIGFDQLSAIAISRDPRAKWLKKARFMMAHPEAVSFAVRGRLNNADAMASTEASLNQMATAMGHGKVGHKIYQIEHHRSHLASAFYASGLPKAALLSVDGSGDFSTTMMGVGNGQDIEVLHSIDFPHSMGIFYTAFTQLLGFPHYGDEYKVMGLAPYGQPEYFDDLKAVVNWHDDGTFSLNEQWFRRPEKGYVSYDEQHRPVVPELYSTALADKFGPVRKASEPLRQEHKNMAASVQKMLEETLFHMLRHLHRKTGLSSLCLAGGVAQNSVANGKITRNTPFTKVYVPSAGHDAGLSMGAAMYVSHQLLQLPRTAGQFHAYTGSSYSNEAIKNFLEKRMVQHTFIQDKQELYRTVASAIASGAVVGWFQGASEFGPRALGNRSILADPRRADAKELLNHKIKRRESFRPFAPSVLEEYASQYFEFCEDTPFMEKVFPIKPEMQNQIPAVTHVDGSGRLQTVCRKYNAPYYDLIDTFRQLTGVPVLLNTSFNENEPIVNTPEEALECFERTNMDMLVLEQYLIRR